MKTMRNLFLLCAGLSLFACSSDDDATQQFPEGAAKVEVRIVPPTTATRSVVDESTATSGSEVQISGTYTVTLTAASITDQDGATREFTQTVYADENKTNSVSFTGVKNPTKVTVVLNGGVADYKSVEIATLNGEDKLATNAPAYGETTTFTPGAAVEGVITYTAAVQMAIPIARLEIGKIKYDPAAATLFSDLTVGGVYLDKLREQGSVYSNGAFNSQGSTLVDYQFGGTDDQYGTGKKYVLGDAAPASFNFISTDGEGNKSVNTSAELPQTDKVYAYNFYGATKGASAGSEPHFKIYFSSTQLTSEANPSPRYAMITSYNTDGHTPIALENGKIYKVTAVALDDKNIVSDEENKTTYNVSVTVTEARWTIEQVNGSWAQ